MTQLDENEDLEPLPILVNKPLPLPTEATHDGDDDLQLPDVDDDAEGDLGLPPVDENGPEPIAMTRVPGLP